MANSHQLLETPNPQERALAVVVKNQVLVEHPDELPPAGTAYKDFPKGMITGAYIQKFGSYIYTMQSPNTKDGDAVLLFAKNKTLTEANTPFKTFSYMGSHRWAPILRGLRVFQDNTFKVISGNKSAPRNFLRYSYVPDCSEGTRFTEEWFTSPIPFVIPQHQVPVPTSVQLDILGLQASWPEVLHPEIKVPATHTATPESGTVGEVGVIAGQVFKETNFTDWLPYFVSDKQELTNGVYFRIRTKVSPPPMPDEDNR